MIPASQSRPEPLLSPPIDASSDDFLASVPPPPPPIKREWRTAWRLLRELIADPEQTEKAIEVFYALGPDQFERSFQRLLVHPEGRRLLGQEVRLLDALCDRAALAALPEGSFGRVFLEHRDRTGLDPDGLLEVHARAQWKHVAELDPMRAWFRDRTILTHDLLHVLTGYDTDPVGEATLLAFVLGQGVGRAQALLTCGAGVARGGPALATLPAPRLAARAAGPLPGSAPLRRSATAAARHRALHRRHRAGRSRASRRNPARVLGELRPDL